MASLLLSDRVYTNAHETTSKPPDLKTTGEGLEFQTRPATAFTQEGGRQTAAELP